MVWLELSFAVADEVKSDLLADALGTIGFNSFETTDALLKAYVEENLYEKEKVLEILNHPLFTEISWLSTKQLADKNWNEIWESNYSPVIINSQCRVRAPFHQPDDHFAYDLVIEPRMSFGTAHHETTSLVMQLMFQYIPAERQVLDMGCGTAVLAILAMKLKARSAVAIDIDEWAFNNAIDNLRLNKVEHVTVELGDVRNLGCRTFDYILANINRNILLADIKFYAQALLSGGYLLLSGFYLDDLPAIHEEAQSNCLTYVDHIVRNNWVAVVYYKR
jgi:ribosomal protein L11 methyltransferase